MSCVMCIYSSVAPFFVSSSTVWCSSPAHLAIAAEGLLALQKMGIRPAVALDAINTSSGRSLATEKRMPERILSRTFDHGFAISECIRL